MTFHDDELDDFLREKLKLIEPIPPRDPENARYRRDDYIKQVKYLQNSKSLLPLAGLLRRKPWLNFTFQRPSFIPFAAALFILFTLLLSGWGTVYAAQESLPDDFLYPVKLTAEKVQLAFSTNPETRIKLLTTYTDRRVEEATTLVLHGEPISEEILGSMNTYLDELFASVAKLDESSAEQAIKRIQIHLRDQEQAMTNVMNSIPEGLEPPLIQLQAMIKARQQEIHMGLEKSDTSQNPNQLNNQQSIFTIPVTETITTTVTITPTVRTVKEIPPGQYGPGPCDSEESGDCNPAGYQDPFGPFEGDTSDPDDSRGYGSGSDEEKGLLQPSKTPKPKESEQSQETPRPGKNDGNGKDDGDAGENKDSGKGGDQGKGGKP